MERNQWVVCFSEAHTEMNYDILTGTELLGADLG